MTFCYENLLFHKFKCPRCGHMLQQHNVNHPDKEPCYEIKCIDSKYLCFFSIEGYMRDDETKPITPEEFKQYD